MGAAAHRLMWTHDAGKSAGSDEPARFPQSNAAYRALAARDGQPPNAQVSAPSSAQIKLDCQRTHLTARSRDRRPARLSPSKGNPGGRVVIRNSSRESKAPRSSAAARCPIRGGS